jgi:hypothetical protein
MRTTTWLVGILLFLVGSVEARTTRTQHAPKPLSSGDIEHGLKSVGRTHAWRWSNNTELISS